MEHAIAIIADPAANQPHAHDHIDILAFMLNVQWAPLAVRRFWTRGYRVDSIQQHFYALPACLRDAIRGALDAAQRRADRAQQQHGPAGAGHRARFLCADAGWEEDLAAWEADAAHGYESVCFDPATQECVAAAANPRAAELHGMRREELLWRLARRDVPLPLAPLDALRALLHAVARGAEPRATLYYRALLRGGRAAALVCATSVKTLHANGLVRQVPRADAGRRNRPEGPIPASIPPYPLVPHSFIFCARPHL